MAYIVRMPKMGVEMQTGILLDWHVEEGDAVEDGDVLAEIESEKTTAEVTARENGVFRHRVLEAGVEVPPGTALGVVADAEAAIDDLLADIEEENGEVDAATGGASADTAATAVTDDQGQSHGGSESSRVAQSSAGGPSTEQPAAGESTGDGRATPKARRRASEANLPLSSVSGSGPKGAVTEADVTATLDSGSSSAPGGATVERAGSTAAPATPRARKRASDLGVDLATLSGSGPGGAIRAADVESAGEGGTSATQQTSGDEVTSVSSGQDGRTLVEERPLGGMRSTIARRLSGSWEAPHVTVDRRVDAEALLRASSAADDVVSVSDILLKAVSVTLGEHPAFNATFEDDTHRLYEEHNVGVAVDVDAGLVTPVLRDVESKTVTEIAYERGSLTERVQGGRQRPGDLQGGTFTVSNLGVFGVDTFTPIINPPQVAILGVNAIREDPARTETGIEFRRTIGFSLSFDHRVVDGADAARFLDTLATTLEDAPDLV
ncbi:2-oxo acid dehydrogenase subunit E2 [Halomarina salina]|uniref:2-oxo acid dehydrogenase subunit E2 n=1 Tax=Halomarina salina TaxID=1872699 RepID=A0ABD5RSM7_9EURY|nr:2-oxo acid dehydrogenase subunit E2 [Halomarina salina]